jgi:uncharacterized membrane protein YbhN (UPF0104 family)
MAGAQDEPTTPARSRRPSSRLVASGASIAFFAAGLVAITVALAHSANESDISLRPGLVASVLGVALMLGGHVLAARGWAQNFEGRVPTARLTRAYYSSQLGKYLPGGIWQPLSQILLVGREASALRRTAAAYVVSLWSFVVAGATISGLGLAAFGTGLPAFVRVVAGVGGIIAAFSLRRALLGRVLEHVPNRIRRGAGVDDLPHQRTIVRCALWTGAGLLLHGTAYAVLLNAIEPHNYVAPGFAFVAAWLVGFLAIPVPAGIGVREAVLVGCLRTTWPVAPIVAASLAQRLTGIIAELLLVAIAHVPTVTARVRPNRVRSDA